MSNIIYSDDSKKMVTSVIKGSTDVLFPATVETIYGFDHNNNAFFACRDTIQNVEFEINSNLITVGPYSFYNCMKLTSLDLKRCTSLKTISKFAFSLSGIVSIALPPSSLKTIGESAFHDSFLEQIHIPSSVTSIEMNCFRGIHLSQITFAEDIVLKVISTNVFRFAPLKTITIPKTAEILEWGCFEDNNILTEILVQSGSQNFCSFDGVLFDKDLTVAYFSPAGKTGTFTFPNTTKTVGSLCFKVSKLTTINIPEGVTKLCQYSFASSSITSITLPESLSTLEDRAFEACKKLQNVTLPPSLKVISNYAFTNCLFESITIPEGVETLGVQCFSYNPNLKKVFIPSTVTEFGGGVFVGCSENLVIEFDNKSRFYINDQYIIMDKQHTYIREYIGFKDCAHITVEDTITAIMAYAFSKTSIEEIKFSEKSELTTISEGVFMDCSQLKTINIPSKVASISRNVFQGCCNLTNIVFPASLKTVGHSLFLSSSVKSVDFSKTQVITLPEYSFNYCHQLETILLPPKLNSTGSNLFVDCYSLKKITFPASFKRFGKYSMINSSIEEILFDGEPTITEIGDYAFSESKSLSKITIPETVIRIGYMAFYMTNITQITIPFNCQEIDGFCFSQCPSLRECFLTPNSMLSTLGLSVFEGSSSLRNITGNNDHYIVENGALFTEDRTTLIVFPPASPYHVFFFPQYVRKVMPSSFYECKNLLFIGIPENSIEIIQSRAFANCTNLRTINIPSSVKSIENDAFAGCTSLKCGVIVGSEEIKKNLIEKGKMNKGAFDLCAPKVSLHCSNLLLPLYKLSFFISAILSI